MINIYNKLNKTYRFVLRTSQCIRSIFSMSMNNRNQSLLCNVTYWVWVRTITVSATWTSNNFRESLKFFSFACSDLVFPFSSLQSREYNSLVAIHLSCHCFCANKQEKARSYLISKPRIYWFEFNTSVNLRFIVKISKNATGLSDLEFCGKISASPILYVPYFNLFYRHLRLLTKTKYYVLTSTEFYHSIKGAKYSIPQMSLS